MSFFNRQFVLGSKKEEKNWLALNRTSLPLQWNIHTLIQVSYAEYDENISKLDTDKKNAQVRLYIGQDYK